MEKILAGYIRVSTEMQVERDSLTNQEEILQVLAGQKIKNGRFTKMPECLPKTRTDPLFRRCLMI